MLAASVYALKGLFVQQTGEVMALCNLAHYLHCKLVVVNSYIGGGEYGRKLMLGGSCLVMFGFCENAQLPKLLV